MFLTVQTSKAEDIKEHEFSNQAELESNNFQILTRS